MSEAPEVVAYTRIADGGRKWYAFYCEYCRMEHLHGHSGLGHRTAHCTNPDSPYLKTGYILTEAKRKAS